MTWAEEGDDYYLQDGDDDDDDEDDEQRVAPQHRADGDVPETPAAVKVKGVDPLFADLRAAALANQAPIPTSEGDHLTSEQLHMRRSDRCNELITAYASEYWALADELLLRAWTSSSSLLKTNSETATRSRSKYADIGSDDAVNAALAAGGVEAAWKAHLSDQKDSSSTTPSQLPTEDELADFILHLRRPEDDNAVEALRKRMVHQKEQFLSRLASLSRLEVSASTATARELDKRGAVAALCGSNARYFIRRTAVTLGRGGAAGVDVDLSAETDLNTSNSPSHLTNNTKSVSRQQAQLFLDVDGVFKVRCLGRRVMNVNGQPVRKGEVAVLPHLSLLRVGSLALLFVVNKEALDRIEKRSAALVLA